MVSEFIIVIIGSILIGAGGMYFIQKKERLHELEKIEKLTRSVLDGNTLKVTAAGEESIYAKIEYEIIRTQEMLCGREEEIRKNHDKMQKLISEIAHQIRTPLTNIKTYQTILKQKMTEVKMTEANISEANISEANISKAIISKENKADGDIKGITVRDCMLAMEKSEEKLNFLVESFIKMSRMEQHIIQIKKGEGDILQTIRNVLGQIQLAAEKKHLKFDITIPKQMVCLHDANWLGEAIYNVLDNAVKYSEDGGIVKIEVSQNDMLFSIGVRDFGLGIEQGEENKIFQRFYRGERVTTQEGLGIGLYFSREIVNLHGGFLRAKRMQPGLQMDIKIPC
ncbi:MAG: ATP-binding protein [Lachnospiraceae bacterium]|nr:ATP-binding protein [Lachnospiraceae bacterium]MDD3617459.1 ATP-binding protein [Lachnospiraceae bacterium]